MAEIFIESFCSAYEEPLGFFARGVIEPGVFIAAVHKSDETAVEYSEVTVPNVRYGYQITTYDNPKDPETEYYHRAEKNEPGAELITIINCNNNCTYAAPGDSHWMTWEQVKENQADAE